MDDGLRFALDLFAGTRRGWRGLIDGADADRRARNAIAVTTWGAVLSIVATLAGAWTSALPSVRDAVVHVLSAVLTYVGTYSAASEWTVWCLGRSTRFTSLGFAAVAAAPLVVSGVFNCIPNHALNAAAIAIALAFSARSTWIGATLVGASRRQRGVLVFAVPFSGLVLVAIGMLARGIVTR